MTVYKGASGKAKRYARLRPEVQRRLERLGRERELIYKTLVLTGLRKGELASLTVGQLVLDADPPFLVLDAADEKNREGSTIPLRADLAADLRQWLADKAKAAQEAAGDVPAVAFDPKGTRAKPRAMLGTSTAAGCRADAAGRYARFTVPAGLVRILDRDLKAAGIRQAGRTGPDG